MTPGKGVGVVLVGDPHKTDPASWWEDRRRWAHPAIIGDELRSGTLVPVTTTARLYLRTSRSSSFAAPSRTSLVMGSRSSWGSTACGWTGGHTASVRVPADLGTRNPGTRVQVLPVRPYPAPASPSPSSATSSGRHAPRAVRNQDRPGTSGKVTAGSRVSGGNDPPPTA